jgi:hypothetical protein
MFKQFGKLAAIVGIVGLVGCAQSKYIVHEENENKYGEVYDIPEVQYESDQERAKWMGKELMYLDNNNIQKSEMRGRIYG